MYLDEDVMDHRLVEGLRRCLEDITTTFEEGMTDADDEPQLEFATNSGRVLYTGNVGDFCRLHGEFLASGRQHAGIIVLPHRHLRGVGQQQRRLIQLLNAKSAEEFQNSLVFLFSW